MRIDRVNAGMWFNQMFSSAPLMAILRGTGVESGLALAETAWDLGIPLVEVPIQSDEDVSTLAALVEAGRARGKKVGAGTVLSVRDVALAAGAGAAFTVSPGLDLGVVSASEEAGLASLPGISTPSEIQAASRAGLTWVKAFPARALGTDWFRLVRGPFPQLNIVATGGMDSSNAEAFLDAGVQVIAVGSALADPTELPKLARVMAR